MPALSLYQTCGTAPKNVGRTCGSTVIIFFMSASVHDVHAGGEARVVRAPPVGDVRVGQVGDHDVVRRDRATSAVVGAQLGHACSRA